MKLESVAWTLLAALCGCAAGPDYVRPETELPARYTLRDAPLEAKQIEVDAQWWRQLADPQLDALINRALEKNGDLRVARARVEEARAASREVFANLFPQIDFLLGSTHTKNSGKAAQQGGNGLTRDARTAGLAVAYEIDLWGRARRANEAAGARLLASDFGADALKVSLAAMVTQQYLALRAADSALTLARDSRERLAESLALQRQRLAAGLGSQLEVLRVESALDAQDAQIAGLIEQRALRENMLGWLCAEPGLSVPPGDVLALPRLPAPPAGLPSDLIAQRADVRAAEQALIAANAGIGLARAAYFPKLALTGRLGFESQALTDLLEGGATTGSFGVGISVPILDFGKINAQVDQAEARSERVRVEYQNTLQAAFKDVRDALVSLRQRSESEAVWQQRSDRAAELLRLSQARYQAGYSAYLEVLDAQRAENEAKAQLTEARRAQLAATVDLYKALGAGWGVERPPRQASPATPPTDGNRVGNRE